jgi:integrase
LERADCRAHRRTAERGAKVHHGHKTYSRYEGAFRLYVLPELGGTRITEISDDRVEEFILSLLQKKVQKSERKLAKDSIRNIVSALRSGLSHAVKKKWLAANPAAHHGKLYSSAPKIRDEVDIFTREEIPVLLDVVRKHYGFENYVLTLTLLHTGLRAGEAAGLKWSDFDFKDRFIIVRRQYDRGRERKTKTKKIRNVDMSDVLQRELQVLKKQRQEEYLAKGKNEIPEWVFLNSLEKPPDMGNFRGRIYWKACDKAKIRRRRVHDTRHTFASILLMNGESPAYVKDQLGHSSIKMTVDVYGHFVKESNRQAVNRLPAPAGLMQPDATPAQPGPSLQVASSASL